MTVYGLSIADYLGPHYTYADMARIQELVNEELANAGIDDTVYVCENGDKYTFLPEPLVERRPDLSGALARAYIQFMQEMQEEPQKDVR